MTALSNLTVLVRSMRYEAQGIVSLELVPLPPAASLPAFSAGAHIDLHLPTPKGELIRS